MRALFALLLVLVSTNLYAIGFCSEVFNTPEKNHSLEVFGFKSSKEFKRVTGVLSSGESVKIYIQNGEYFFKSKNSSPLLGHQKRGKFSGKNIGFVKIKNQSINLIENKSILRVGRNGVVELPVEKFGDLQIKNAIKNRSESVPKIVSAALEKITQKLYKNSKGVGFAIGAESILSLKVFKEKANENYFIYISPELVFEVNSTHSNPQRLSSGFGFHGKESVELENSKIIRFTENNLLEIVESSSAKTISEAKKPVELLVLATREKSKEEKDKELFEEQALNDVEKAEIFSKYQEQLLSKLKVDNTQDWLNTFIFPLAANGRFLIWNNGKSFLLSSKRGVVNSLDFNNIGFNARGKTRSLLLRSGVELVLEGRGMFLRNPYEVGTLAKLDLSKVPEEFSNLIIEFQKDIEHILKKNSLGLEDLSKMQLQEVESFESKEKFYALNINRKTYFLSKNKIAGLEKTSGFNYGELNLEKFSPSSPRSLSFRIPGFGIMKLKAGKGVEYFYSSKEVDFKLLAEQTIESLSKVNPVFNEYSQAIGEVHLENTIGVNFVSKLRFGVLSKSKEMVLVEYSKDNVRILLPNSSKAESKVTSLDLLAKKSEELLLTSEFVNINEVNSIGFKSLKLKKEIQLEPEELRIILTHWGEALLKRKISSEEIELLVSSVFYKNEGVDYLYPAAMLGVEYFNANLKKLAERFSGEEIVQFYRLGLIGFLNVQALEQVKVQLGVQ